MYNITISTVFRVELVVYELEFSFFMSRFCTLPLYNVGVNTAHAQPIKFTSLKAYFVICLTNSIMSKIGEKVLKHSIVTTL